VLEVVQVRERGRLVGDRVRSGGEDRRAHGAGVEQVEPDRLGAERPHPLSAAGRPMGADHLVPALDQLRDEPGADRPARPCDEDSHRSLLLLPGVTSPGAPGSLV